jgi:tRNA threonylcarbamoyladenosine biosynthesis protein TsaE
MPVSTGETTRHLHSNSPATTRSLGERLGACLRGGQVIALQGDLGAGKTTLTQGIAAGLGITDPVTSPTFTLINEYGSPSGLTLIHVDGYRLGGSRRSAAAEAEMLGIEEILQQEHVVVVIEWAERMAALLPDARLTIKLSHVDGNPSARRIELVACGQQSMATMRAVH